MSGARVRALSPRVILALGLVMPMLYAFPGMMSQDSFDILIEARSGVYTDAHPPLLAALWHVCDAILPGAILMLLLQLVAFELGLYLVLRRMLATPRAAAWTTAALLLFPPILAPLGMIWKDCLMAGMLILGAGLLLAKHPRGAFVALFVATGVRYNAAPAAGALIIMLYEWRPDLRPVSRYAIATGAWLAITVAAFGANAALTDRQMYFTASSLAPYDIAGVLAHLDEDLSDAEMEKILAGTQPMIHAHMHAALRARYSPSEFMHLISPEGSPFWNLPLYGTTPAPAEQRAAIMRTWKALILAHPGAYLAHRFAVMREVLYLGGVARPTGAIPRRVPYFPNIARDLGLNTGWSRFQVRLSKVMYRAWESIPVFAPWIYALLAVVLLPFARKQRDVLALLASGILLELTLLPLAQSADFRYSHWLIVVTCVAVVALVSRRRVEAKLLTNDV